MKMMKKSCLSQNISNGVLTEKLPQLSNQYLQNRLHRGNTTLPPRPN